MPVQTLDHPPATVLPASRRGEVIRAVILQTVLALVLVLALEPVLRLLAPRGGVAAIFWSALLVVALRLASFEFRRLFRSPEQQVLEASEDDDQDDRPWLLREPIGWVAGFAVLGSWWRGRAASRHVVLRPEGDLASLVIARSAAEREALARERWALTLLDRSPGFARLRGTGVLPGGEAFLMQSFNASPLAWQLAGHGSANAVARIGLTLTEILERAHDRGVCLRSFALEDIQLDESGRAEFVQLSQAAEMGLTHASKLPESLRVVAPELRGSGAMVEVSADIYSLGVALLELWAGETISAPTMGAAELLKRAEAVFARLSEDEPSRRLSIVLREALSQRADRPRSMAKMGAALRWVLQPR